MTPDRTNDATFSLRLPAPQADSSIEIIIPPEIIDRLGLAAGDAVVLDIASPTS